jgi:hypothetical protein
MVKEGGDRSLDATILKGLIFDSPGFKAYQCIKAYCTSVCVAVLQGVLYVCVCVCVYVCVAVAVLEKYKCVGLG